MYRQKYHLVPRGTFGTSMSQYTAVKSESYIYLHSRGLKIQRIIDTEHEY